MPRPPEVLRSAFEALALTQPTVPLPLVSPLVAAALAALPLPEPVVTLLFVPPVVPAEAGLTVAVVFESCPVRSNPAVCAKPVPGAAAARARTATVMMNRVRLIDASLGSRDGLWGPAGADRPLSLTPVRKGTRSVRFLAQIPSIEGWYSPLKRKPLSYS
jgi:hypothetical protein